MEIVLFSDYSSRSNKIVFGILSQYGRIVTEFAKKGTSILGYMKF